jgi:DNA-binding response OmpR family regulator
LFLSALANEKDAEAGLRAGASAYLSKPFDEQSVLNKIKDLLSNLSSGQDKS